MAAIPDAQGVIHGCYAKSGGQLKVIDTAKGEKCPPGYTALDWNKQGIAGTNGTNGANGIDGIDGIDGEDGAPGKDGTNGIDGIDGEDVHLARHCTHAIDGIDGEDGARQGRHPRHRWHRWCGRRPGRSRPSDAYATFTQSPGTILSANYVTVKSLSLPPGSYTASATAMLFADGSVGTRLCRLLPERGYTRWSG